MQYSVPRCENPFDFLPAVSALENPKLVEDYFQEVITGYGGTYVLMCRVPQPHELLADCILMDTRPVAWARRYRDKGYMTTDPLVLTAQRRATPCSWSQAMIAFPKGSIEQLIHTERLTNGVTDGLLVPIHTNMGHAGLVSISAKAALADPAFNALTLMSLVVHNHLSGLQRSDASELDGFTLREIECLTWAAAGKSDAETAVILDLSAKTVNYHIEGAKRRMNAASRTHAVASAFRLGLIN